MDFASAYVLEEEEEEEIYEEPVGNGIQMEAELDYDSGNDDIQFECDIMEFDDEDFPRPKTKARGSALNTVNLKLQVLRDELPEQIMKDKFRYTCANVRNCGALLSHIDKPIDQEDSPEKIWRCRFCGVERPIKNWPPFDDIPNGDILFVSEPDNKPDLCLDPGENTVIFVLDCSGSMSFSVDHQPQQMGMMGMGGGMMGGGMMSMLMGGGMGGMMGQLPQMLGMGMPKGNNPDDKPTGKSRLQALRDGVVGEMKKLKETSPKTRVGVVYFHNEITILGDGSKEPETVSGPTLNNYTQLLTKGQRQERLGYVSESCDKLVASLEGLREGGQTALGPALVIAMAMAAKGKTSKVILCTDGFANIGLGSIAEGVGHQTENFYKDVAAHCKTHGVSVSLISFDECGYAQSLGELPVETGGLLGRVEPKNPELKIQDVLTRKTMATNAHVKFVVNKQLYVFDKGNKEEERSNYTHLVGNIHEEMSHAFKFGFRSDEESKQQRKAAMCSNPLLNEKPREDDVKITDVTGKDNKDDNKDQKMDATDKQVDDNSEKKDKEKDGTMGITKESTDDNQAGNSACGKKEAESPDDAQSDTKGDNMVAVEAKTDDNKDDMNAVDSKPYDDPKPDNKKDIKAEGEANSDEKKDNVMAVDNTEDTTTTKTVDDLNKEEVPFQIQIFYVDLNGVEGTRIWTSLKPITGNKQKAEEASNKETLIENMIQTEATRLLDIHQRNDYDINLQSEIKKMIAEANKLQEKPDLNEEQSNILNDFVALIQKISQGNGINDEIAEKLRKFQASGIQKAIKPAEDNIICA